MTISDRAEPNLVPLLDLVLQLVMFFMMCANFVMEQVDQTILLPVAQQAKPMSETGPDVVFLNVTADGALLNHPGDGAMLPFLQKDARDVGGDAEPDIDRHAAFQLQRDAPREYAILTTRVPGIERRLANEVVGFVQRLRGLDLFKQPGIAETIEWSRALLQLDAVVLDPAIVDDSLGVLLKYQDDIAKVSGSEAARLLREMRAA